MRSAVAVRVPTDKARKMSRAAKLYIFLLFKRRRGVETMMSCCSCVSSRYNTMLQRPVIDVVGVKEVWVRSNGQLEGRREVIFDTF